MKSFQELSDISKVNAVKNHCLLFNIDYNVESNLEWVLTSPHFNGSQICKSSDVKIFNESGELANWNNPNQFK